MAFVISEDRESGVALSYYVKKSKYLVSMVNRRGIEIVEEFADFIYLIMDPRSDYFDMELDINKRIKVIIEDYPQYASFIDDDDFKLLLSYIKRLYDSEVKTILKEYMQLLSDSKSTITNLKQSISNIVIDDKSLKFLTEFTKFISASNDLHAKYKKALAEYIVYIRDVEQQVSDRALSILETWLGR